MPRTLAIKTMVGIACALSTLAIGRDASQRGDAVQAPSRIYKLEELTWPRIAAFDRERTLVLVTVGMIEEHGPHLPVGADTIGVLHETAAVASRVSRALPNWNVVVMPPLHYGHAGANAVGNMLVHPGTYGIRESTLRSLVADVGGQLAQNGFKWIFVLNGHAAPTHSLALDEACDFVSESFDVTMLHLTALFRGDAALQARGEQIGAKHFSSRELSSFGIDVHAGVGETSQMLAVRRDLVRSDYRKLPAQAGSSFEQLQDIARARGWQGYFSAPAQATAAYGRAVKEWWIDGFVDLVLRAVRGEDMFAHPRVPERVPPPLSSVVTDIRANEAAFAAKLDTWLQQRATRSSSRERRSPQ